MSLAGDVLPWLLAKVLVRGGRVLWNVEFAG